MQHASPVPVFKLYGEQSPWPTPDLLHCEDIASRSKLHNWQIRPHRHNGLFQLLYLAGGSALVQLEDQQAGMKPGQILLIPQMCVHGFQFDHDAKGLVLTMTYPLIHRLTRQAGDGLLALGRPGFYQLRRDARSGHIKAALRALHDEYCGQAPYRHLQLESLLSTLLVWLAGSGAPVRPPEDEGRAAIPAARHFVRFNELLELHYSAHQPLAWYAAQLGITAAHLNALCRKNGGKSALALLHARLVLEAKRCLVYTSMTISAVSDALGFADPAYFSRFFTREAGLSPKTFRRQAGTLQASIGAAGGNTTSENLAGA